MVWAYGEFGEEVYSDISKHAKAIVEWCEKQELDLNTKQTKALTNVVTWQKQLDFINAAGGLMEIVGTHEYNDFNIFRNKINDAIKVKKLNLSSSEKNAVLDAVSWYDGNAEKVIKGTVKLSGDKLEQLLHHLDCKENQLADYGYYALGKKGEYLEYETESYLRDTENVPLKENIHEYFLWEVKPNVAEAWINMDATKIGYEISFNKYFYHYKPLRTIEEVTDDILKPEELSDGLIHEILNIA